MRITPTARRIAHAHNCCVPALSGGLLAFDSEGRDGRWFSGRFRPPAAILYPVGRGCVSVRDVQAWLDERDGREWCHDARSQRSPSARGRTVR